MCNLADTGKYVLQLLTWWSPQRPTSEGADLERPIPPWLCPRTSETRRQPGATPAQDIFPCRHRALPTAARFAEAVRVLAETHGPTWQAEADTYKYPSC
jgi:hypothetical protein